MRLITQDAKARCAEEALRKGIMTVETTGCSIGVPRGYIWRNGPFRVGSSTAFAKKPKGNPAWSHALSAAPVGGTPPAAHATESRLAQRAPSIGGIGHKGSCATSPVIGRFNTAIQTCVR